jgi:hypothetical protein
MRRWYTSSAALICSALLLLTLRKQITCSFRLERANYLRNSRNVRSNPYVRYEILTAVKMPLSSALKMRALCSSETQVSTYKTTQLCNLEDKHRHFHRRENITSRHVGFEILTAASMRMAVFSP